MSSRRADGKFRGGPREKFQGGGVDLAEALFRCFEPHGGHQIILQGDPENPEFAIVYCLSCRSEVTWGSRELIEMVYLEAVAVSERSQ